VGCYNFNGGSPPPPPNSYANPLKIQEQLFNLLIFRFGPFFIMIFFILNNL